MILVNSHKNVLVLKSPIVENVLDWAKHKADQQIKKTDGSKRERYVYFHQNPSSLVHSIY